MPLKSPVCRQLIDALFSDNVLKEVENAAVAFVVVGGVSLLMSVFEMGFFTWSGVPEAHGMNVT